MSIFNKKKKSQLEAEWQIVERREGESILDALERTLAGKLQSMDETFGKRAKAPPSDGEWLVAATMQKLSNQQVVAGLEAVRLARKVGLN